MRFLTLASCIIITAAVLFAQEGELRKSAGGDTDLEAPSENHAKSDRRVQRLKAMQDIAEAITVETIGAQGKTKVELAAGARFRFSTPEIGCFDGTAWIWGVDQRPVALLTVSAEQFAKGDPCQWSYELTSLAPAELSVQSREGWQWNPEKAGLDFQPLPSAPSPADNASRRLRQMKEIARRFDAYGMYGAAQNERAELRTLPTPIYRYSDVPAGIHDGAIFFLAGGTNPEALLAIELSGAESAPEWRYALNRVSAAELHARLDGAEVWSCHWRRDRTTRSPYYLLIRPMRRELADD